MAQSAGEQALSVSCGINMTYDTLLLPHSSYRNTLARVFSYLIDSRATWCIKFIKICEINLYKHNTHNYVSEFTVECWCCVEFQGMYIADIFSCCYFEAAVSLSVPCVLNNCFIHWSKPRISLAYQIPEHKQCSPTVITHRLINPWSKAEND